MSAPRTGPCCLGNQCKFPTLELRKEHTCPACEGIVHILCGVFHEEMDKYVCFPCNESLSQAPAKEKEPSIQPTAPSASTSLKPPPPPPIRKGNKEVQKKAAKKVRKAKRNENGKMICASCGEIGHLRKSSMKCRLNPLNQKPKAIDNDSNSVSSQRPATTIFTTNKNTTKKNNDSNSAATTDDENTTTSSITGGGATTIASDKNQQPSPYRLYSPNFVYVGKPGEKHIEPVLDVASSSFKPQDTVFKTFTKDHRGKKVEIVPTPKHLTDQYLSLELIEQIRDNSNNYRKNQKKTYPNRWHWTKAEYSKPFTNACIYQFIALIYYFGIVKLPSKTDYWSADPYMPQHTIARDLDMSRARFEFIWRHFHLNCKEDLPSATDDGDDGTNTTTNASSNAGTNDDFEDYGDVAESDDSLIEQTVERVQNDQETAAEDSTTSGDGNDDQSANSDVSMWFHKLQPLVDHVRQVSFDLVFILGTLLSLDEMMIRFMGRSNETHRMKNKPIGEGYKFFVLATKDGFVVNFTPDGRSAQKNKQQEYQQDDQSSKSSAGKIETMILYVMNVIERFKDKQKERIRGYGRKTRGMERQHDEGVETQDLNSQMNKFCLAIDNYFSIPSAIKKLRDIGVGVVGTARFRKGWPPEPLRKVNQSDVSFNDFYWCRDEFGTLVGRWMDNGLVCCVSTLHRVEQTILRKRRRPRMTDKNKAHVREVWGNEGVKKIKIPTLIDDYNHWMGGVDLADQRIAYYQPDLRCHRNWIPMFIQILSIIRSNSYIVYRSCSVMKPMTHKQFTLEMISALMMNANDEYQKNLPRQTRTTHKKRKGAHHLELSSTAGNISELPPDHENLKPPVSKRRRMTKQQIQSVQDDSSCSFFALFPKRKDKPSHLHCRVDYGHGVKPGVCVYCSFQFMKDRAAGKNKNYNKSIKRTSLVCRYCTENSPNHNKCFLCKEHFEIFHST